MNQTYKQIFKDLFESVDGLYAYTFYSRYRITPGVLFEFIEKHEVLEMLNFVDGKISLTEKGRVKAMQYAKNVINPVKDKYAKIPNEFLDYKLSINSLYLPNANSIDYNNDKKGGNRN